MPGSTQLPRGIRNNNPGNLRISYGQITPTELNEGFAVFMTPHDGLVSLCKLTYDYYKFLGHITLSSFIAAYAPSTENDVQKYMLTVAQRIGMSMLAKDTRALGLDHPWLALNFMRAIVWVENGPAPSNREGYPEWFTISQWIDAMATADKWVTL